MDVLVTQMLETEAVCEGLADTLESKDDDTDDDDDDDESIVTNLSNTSPSFFTKAIVDMH